MKHRALRLVTLVLCLVPMPAFAHPGHGTTAPEGWQHYLTEPLHVAVTIALTAIVVASWFGYRRRRTRREPVRGIDRERP